jgi:hypothetical protein
MKSGFVNSALFWGATSLIFIGAFYVLREHWGHALGLFPYLILLACPLMHLFHGHHRHGSQGADKEHQGHNHAQT